MEFVHIMMREWFPALSDLQRQEIIYDLFPGLREQEEMAQMFGEMARTAFHYNWTGRNPND